MIDKLPQAELEQVREGRFYQALLAELILRQRSAEARMVGLGSNGQDVNRILALAGRAAAYDELHKHLEQVRGKDDE